MKNKNNKGQIKIQETAFVLLALVLLFSIIFLFYFKIKALDLVEKAEELREEQAMSVLEKIIAMPEISCTSNMGEGSLCVDKAKLNIFPSLEGYDVWWYGLSEIKVLKIYPNEEEFVLYSSNKEKETTYSTFLKLCEQGAIDYKCSIGIITVSTEPINS